MAAGTHSLSVAFLAISDRYATLFFLEILIFVNLFTKWMPAAILDIRKSLLVAFLAISDQYKTFLIFFFTKWLPSAIWNVRNSLWFTHFWPF